MESWLKSVGNSGFFSEFSSSGQTLRLVNEHNFNWIGPVYKLGARKMRSIALLHLAKPGPVPEAFEGRSIGNERCILDLVYSLDDVKLLHADCSARNRHLWRPIAAPHC